MATVLGASLSACGTTQADSGRVTLQVVATQYGDRSGNSTQRYWDKLVGEFQFSHPDIAVKVTVYDRSTVDKRVADMIKAGNVPDLAQTPGTFADYAAQDRLYSAGEVLSTSSQAAIVSSLADAGSVNGEQYGMPFAADTRVLFYNTDLFEEAGLDGPPQTWKELRADAEALKDADVQIPYALPLGSQDAEAEAFNWMISGGGGYTDDSGQYAIDSPQNVRTFTWLRDELVGAGLTNPDPATTDRDSAYEAFLRGDVGMLNGHPTLMERALEHGIHFDTAPIPGRDGPVKGSVGVTDWMMAFKKNGHRQAIRTFLDFVYNDKNVLGFATKYDMLPVTTPATQQLSDDTEHKRLRPFLDELDTARFYPVSKSSWSEVSRAVAARIGSTVVDGGDPAEVLGRIEHTAHQAEADARSD
ncbi:MAG TPA: extracellular solute-binding protein [Streptomyces sp.]|nr:extracellular solute-binding protein [Streptomyces sp.]